MSQCLNPDCLYKNPEKMEICDRCGSKLLLIERYRADRILHKTQNSNTFLAVDECNPSQPNCIIKQFLPQPGDTHNDEVLAAELFARLDNISKHEQIPDLMAYLTQDNCQYLVWESIEGENLESELANKGVFNEQQVWQLLNDLLRVLQFVHGHNVIHGKIEPENIIRTSDEGKLVLVDFGITIDTENTHLSPGDLLIASTEYTAPEQARGKLKFASDLYSLGLTCIHLLTNIPPLQLFDIGEGDWRWREHLRDNPVSDRLGQVIDKLIEPAAKRRYQSVESVLEVLNGSSLAPNNNNSEVVTQKPRPNLKSFEFEVVTVTQKRSGFLQLKKTPHINRSFRQAEYFEIDLGDGVSMEMVSIPEGKFLMGSPQDEQERFETESPLHFVNIAPFFMSKYPVTQSQWQVLMHNNPSNFKDSPNWKNRPVEQVSWYEALKFCEKLSEIGKDRFRLPSEAEWEYACRALTTTPFYCGETLTPDLAKYYHDDSYDVESEGEYRQGTTEVGSFSPNSFGLYDLHGLVWEWCADTWHENYNGAPVDGSAWRVADENHRPYLVVLRGGSWNLDMGYSRSAARARLSPDGKLDFIGFRVVCF